MLKFILLFLTLTTFANSKMINPITDVCWDCVFPITIAGINVSETTEINEKDYQTFCFCKGTPPKAGIPSSFWEPLYMIDVTTHAFKLVGLGGIEVFPESSRDRGSSGIIADGPSKQSFYQSHFYQFPLFALLEILTDFVCISKEEMGIPFFSELDPTWKDDQLALILNPEAGFFSNPVTQGICAIDCLSATANVALDKLFWCAGCQGSLYPLNGTVAHHVGTCQATSLIAHRVIAKLHRAFQLKGFSENDYCESKFMPIIKKSIYKTQITHPIPQTSGNCHPLGSSDVLWGAFKTYPYGGEDVVYLIWSKKQCCLDAIKAAMVAGGIK